MAVLRKPLRPNVALAVDGGGIKGVMVARALMRLEEAVGKPVPAFVRLTAGTSTGAIIAAAIARGLDAATIYDLYVKLGPRIFRRTWRNLPLIKYLVRYQYSSSPLEEALAERLGDITIGRLHATQPDFHMVITATDIYANCTRFIKLYKPRYAGWKLRDAVMASSIVPSVFPVFAHRFTAPDLPPDPGEEWIPEPRYWVDGGVGSYSNPCYLAAYEIAFCLRQHGWRLDNTTLISVGTGKTPAELTWAARLKDFRRTPAQFFGPEWVFPTVDTFLQDAAVQQVRLVKHFFVDAVAHRMGGEDAALDFRRYNIEFDEAIEMDQAEYIPVLSRYGEALGQMIVDDVQEDVGTYSCGEAAHPFSLGALGGGFSSTL
jgi:hypothetical protein